MSQEDSAARIPRRTFLAGLGTVGAATALGTVPTAGAQTDESDAPAIEWRSDYSGGDEAYDITLQTAFQTADGGYALAGDGTPITETRAETEQFVLVRADADGSEQWHTFVDDDTEDTTELSFGDVVQTADGGYVLVGHATNPAESLDDQVGGEVAEAAKLTPDGTVEWFRRLNAFEDDESADGPDTGNSDNAMFLTAAATADGGVLAGGSFEGSSWLVAFDGDGTVAWEAQYTGFSVAEIWPQAGGGAHVVVEGKDTYEALRVDSAGAVTQSTTLGIDYEQTPHNHDCVATADGGYAYTGRDADRENMVLGKLDGDGAAVWREEYDGSYGGSDWANQVVQTGDGGYALGGYMRAAYDGTLTPAVVQTDGEGTERWRHLFTESEASDVATVFETDDGGYAVLLAVSNTLVRLAPEQDEGPLPGSDARNLDSDPLLEDMDGNGEGEIADVIIYFNERDSETVVNNPERFDFDGDGEAGNIGDVITLFNELL